MNRQKIDDMEKAKSLQKLDEQTREAIQKELVKKMGKSVVFYASSFPSILHNVGINDYKKYAISIEQFVELYLGPQFCFKKDIEINRKKQPGVIIFLNGKAIDEVLDSLSNNTIKTNLEVSVEKTNSITEKVKSKIIKNIILEDSMLDEIKDDTMQVRYGIINRCSRRNGFINTEYIDKKEYPNYELDGSQSVIFETNKVKWEPRKSLIKTDQNIYLVSYHVNGTVTNTKTHLEQPAFDYSYPIKIIQKFSRKKCVRLAIEGDSVVVEQYDNIESSMEEILNSMKEQINVKLIEKHFIQASLFPEIAKNAGLSDFRVYAESVEDFINIYLPEYELKKNITINDIKYPGIIYIHGEKPSMDSTFDNKDEKVNAFEILEKLYDEEKYYEYLSSEKLKQINFCDFPLALMEKTLNCAAHIMFPNDNKKIEIDFFQKELICNQTNFDFIKKWKKNSTFEQDIMEGCSSSSIVSFDLPRHNGYIVELLNGLGYLNVKNDNYQGLARRFAISVNGILPYMFFIRACVHNSPSAVGRCISEYIQVVKKLQQSQYYSFVDERNKMYSITEFLIAINKHVIKLTEVPRGLRTSIVSVYVDAGEMNLLRNIIPLISSDAKSADVKLVDLYFNFEECTEQEIIDLLEENVSLQLMQKIVALVWERYSDMQELPMELLKVLCWICLNDASTSVDEILRYHFVKKQFTKLQKVIQLLNSYNKVCMLAQNNISMHVVASYIRFVICEDVNTEKLREVCQEIETSWLGYSEKIFNKVFSQFVYLNYENEKKFFELFKIFRLDIENQLKVQNYYAEWYSKNRRIEQHIPGETISILENLFSNRAYKAFVDSFMNMQKNITIYEINENIVKEYIISLIELQRYGEAISYLQQNSLLSKDINDESLIWIIAANFRNNGLSAKAFTIFSDSLTDNDAIELLLNNMKPSQYHIVTCLIALYCHKKDYIRATYLYQIFRSKSENGYTRLYSQVRSCIKSFNGSIKNHYDVVEYAFYSLYCDDLIDFLKWTQLIQIPAIKGYNPIHSFAFFYDKIMANPLDEKVWTTFLEHLLKRIDINAWLVVVCETVLEVKIGYSRAINTGVAIRNIMNLSVPENLPYNFLPYVHAYIMRNNDVSICRELVLLLKNVKIVEHLIDENLWKHRYTNIENEFKIFCIKKYSETGNEIFYSAIIMLGMTFEITEMAILAQTSGDKSYLFKLICRNYLSTNNTAEIIELLNSGEWNNMSSRDSAMLNLLKMLYQEDECLLANKLFVDEEEVYRFKYDCAKILTTYPDKSELAFFDDNCINTKHKLLVYSYIFAVLYDEDIYHKYTFSFEEMQCDEQMYCTYLNFIATVFYAQLEWNQGYPFFYKKWRYLKLFLTEILLEGKNANDQKIIETMEQKGHFASVFLETYRPFTENVKEFWNLESINDTDKKFFLFTLMMGRVGDFVRCKGKLLAEYASRVKELLKNLVAQLDYREVNWSFYNIYSLEIEKGRFDEAIEVANVLSMYAVDALMNLKQRENDKKAIEMFLTIALQEKPSEVTKIIFHLERNQFSQYADILNPLLCSRQFIFLLYGSTRNAIVQRNRYSDTLHFIGLTDYISKYNKAEGLAVKGYLLALKACMDNNRSLAAELLSRSDIFTDVPAQWKNEAEAIRNYANGKVDIFKPDRTITDSSLENERREIKFKFIDRLKKIFGVNERRIDSTMALELYEKYINLKIDIMDRVHAAVDLILNYPRLNKEKQKELRLPTKNSLILMVGLDVVVPEFNLSVAEQISILTDLYNGRKLFRGEKDNVRLLNDYLGQRLKNNISLETWARYSNVIKEYLEENHMIMDFVELKSRILDKCSELFTPNVSYEERYHGLLYLLQLSEGLESVYSRNVFDSIRKMCRQIEDGVRLKIDIVNVNNEMTDGNIYFQIQNIGKCTVSFQNEEYYVVLKQEGHPEVKVAIDNIQDLQSGFITGGKIKVILSGSELSVNVSLSIFKSGNNGKTEIICKVYSNVAVGKVDNQLFVSLRNRYEVGSAVTDSEMLFGRAKLQKALKDMIPSGVTVIYGPSRIGKTSLMNWINNTLTNEKGNVISIVFGGEGGMGKESDYRENFITPKQHLPIPYEDDEKMTEYLMISTIVQRLTSMSMKRRIKMPSQKELSADMINEIVKILKDDSLSVSDRYYWMNKLLTSEEIELWLLLDEFQQVVERWKPQISCEFVKVCKMLLYEGEKSKIKLVICGSDDLLRHMVLEDESVWRQTFPSRTRIAVEPLEKDAFCEMIEKDKKIITTNVSYSESALQALFSYTGGVALYGKEICNAILNEIESFPEKYQDRNIIYASDVSEATQRLLNKQASELDTKAKEGIAEIYEAVTNNLKPDTDMQYLWYIAKWLYTNSDQDSFAESIFTKNATLRDEKEMHDSLEIAVARGILECKESQKDGDIRYIFRTIFYYFAFLGSARNNLDESKIFVRDNNEISQSCDSLVTRLKNEYQSISPKIRLKENLLWDLYGYSEQEECDHLKERISNTNISTGGGDIVTGGSTKHIENKILVQNITNTLKQIVLNGPVTLNDGKLLPSLEEYIPEYISEENQEKIKDLRGEIDAISDDPDLQHEVRENEQRLAELMLPAEKKLTDDYSKAVLDVILEEDVSDIQDDYSIINLTKDIVSSVKNCLPEKFQLQYEFAILLHKLLYKYKKDNGGEIDFCPVALMYCKLIEGLLKEYHARVYAIRLSDKVKTPITISGEKYYWNQFLNNNGEFDSKKFTELNSTMGNFTFHIGFLKDKTDITKGTGRKKPAIMLLSTLPGEHTQNEELKRQWEEHTDALMYIYFYRNNLAHNLDPISSKEMDEITNILFNQGEFQRIIDLSK